MCFNLHSFNHTNLLTFYSTQVSNSVSYLQLYCTAVSQMIKKSLNMIKKITINLFLIVMNVCFILGQPPPPPFHAPTHSHINNLFTVSLFSVRIYRSECAGCSKNLSPSDIVRRVFGSLYHETCFKCTLCDRAVETGDRVYLRDDNKLICEEDYASLRGRGKVLGVLW